MSSSDSYCIDLLSDIASSLNRYVVPLLFVMGNLGNVLNALIFFKKPWRRNVSVLYLNAYLLFNSGYINSGLFASIFTLGFNINAQNSNVLLCKLLYYTAYLFTTLSPTILVLASVDRLLISSQNIDTRLYSSKRLACLSVSVGTCFWVVFYVHILVKMTLQQLSPSYLICFYDFSGVYFEFVSYSTLIINVLLSVVLIALAVLTFKNVRHIRLIPRQKRLNVRSMNKKDFQLLRCLYVHDLVYIVFVTFPSIYAIYLAVSKDRVRSPFEQAIDSFITNVGTFLHHIPYCVSFFIHVGISKAFRHELKRLIYGIIGKDVPTIRIETIGQLNDRASTIELQCVKANKS